MTSLLAADISDAYTKRKNKSEDDLVDVFKRSMVARTGDYFAKEALDAGASLFSGVSDKFLKEPFEQRAAEKFMNPDRRKFRTNLEKTDQQYNSWVKHEKDGIEKGHSREFIAFEKHFNDERIAEYIKELNRQGKVSDLKIKGMEGLGFSVKDLHKDVLKNMVYQAMDESKDVNGNSYLTLLANKYDNFKNIYETNIPTGETRKLTFTGMDSPKNFGQFITSKIKNIFDKGDNDERLSRAIDNIASNDEDLIKDKRFARIVETKRALENIDSTFSRDAQALLNLEKEEIFQENFLIKKFNELGATGKKVETIESGDNGLYKLTKYTYTTAAGEKSHEVREPLTNINDAEGRLMGNDFQSRPSTNAYHVGMKYLSNRGMTQLTEIIDNQNLVDGSGNPLTPSSRDITIEQYDFMMQAINVISVQNQGEFRKQPAEERAATITAISSMVNGMKESVRDAYRPYPVSKGIDDSAFFVDPSTRLQLKDLKFIIPNEKQRLAYNKNNLPEGMTPALGKLLAEHLSQKDAKISAQRKLQETTVAFVQYWNEQGDVSETVRQNFLEESIEKTSQFAPKKEVTARPELKSLLKDKLQPARTDPLFNPPSLFPRP